MTLHIRLANDDDPANHTIEITTQEQVFAPAKRYQPYIRVKGITFLHAGNGFPVPQRGMVSMNRGHHFIFEDKPSSGPTAWASISATRNGRLRDRPADGLRGDSREYISLLRD